MTTPIIAGKPAVFVTYCDHDDSSMFITFDKTVCAQVHCWVCGQIWVGELTAQLTGRAGSEARP